MFRFLASLVVIATLLAAGPAAADHPEHVSGAPATDTTERVPA